MRLAAEVLMRHLPANEIVSALKRGSAVEQFLGGGVSNGQRTIRWIEIRPQNETFEVWQFESADLGDIDSSDFYDWGGEEDEVLVSTTRTADEALQFAETYLNARTGAWTNPGVSQDDYRDYVKSQRSPDWTPALP